MSAQPFRLAQGGLIDRGAPLEFTFNGRRCEGYRGDTLASALLANGVHLVARSFKYHRPRGIASAGPEEPCALVKVGGGARVLPNLPATMVELYAGLAAESINCWPGVGFDLGAVGNLVSRLMPAGFYYKTFMWPSRAWMTYERVIRRIAGLGEAPEAPDPDRYEKRFGHCDVLVIGAGPAGTAAALAAGGAGARVILADERAAPGGQLLFRDERIDGARGREWISRSLAALGALPEVRVLPRTTAFGYYDHNLVALLERVTDHLPERPAHLPRQRLWKVRAEQVIVAAGAIERPLAFANNDLPGIMPASAAQRYVAQYAVRAGSRAVFFTNNDSAYEAVLACADAGIEVVAVIDTRTPLPGCAAALQARGVPVQPAHVVLAARGGKHVGAASVAPINAGGVRLTGPAHEIECDLLCVSGGWDPAVHLFSQSGGRLEFDEEQYCFVPAHAAQSTRAAGAASGAFMLPDCIAQGTAAGLAAARDAGFNAPREIAPPKRAALALMPLWEVPGDGGKKFVDLHNDVTTADIAVAAREGYVAVEHTKRYTTSGMGVDQGKTGNVLAYAILGGLTERTIPEVGTTTFRPPYTPVTMGALAGRETGERFDPLRKTPLTDWHVAAGAVFEPVGLWRRPLYYPRPGEDMHAAVERERRAVRSAAGILDASTLGKIDVQGPDAATLLNRVYTNAWHNLAVGRCRYGFMLREDGMVFDDGVTTRLGEHHFLVSTTSGGAEGVLHWLEEWLQCEWRDLKVYLTPVTAHWATICVTGPRARDVLANIPCDIDISPSAFPHMSMREGTVAGVPARLFRVSFTGELSFEINVPARYGLALWEALMDAGAPCGITPLGTEALHVLRAEKGYIAVGHETDGTVMPLDLGMDWIVDMKKGDFLGKRSLSRTDTARADRKQLVGLLTEDAGTVVPQGSQIIAAEDAARIANPPLPMLGHVTSCYMSGTLGRSIALALVAGGRNRMGERVAVVARGQPVYATIASPRFYDPKGERLNA